MRRYWNNKGRIIFCIVFLVFCSMLLALCFILPDKASSGPYLDSAHAQSYGVNRSSLSTFGYAIGNCAHCHEQHASIGGSEPAPAGGSPSKYELFETLFTSQSTLFCFQCHTDTIPQQQTLPAQYNYSRIAGGDTNTCPAGIRDAFQFVSDTGASQLNCGSSYGSSHFLANIQTFLTNKWNFGSTTAEINPCSGCHNPHRAQRDPHTTTTRGWPVSRPSQHSKDNNAWGLWGDVSAERMSNYTASYQAPYRFNSTTTYEPDGSTTQDGSNLTDYATFCTDCHNTSNTIYSTVLGRNLRTIDWNNEKHGKGNADGAISMNAPYGTVMGKVLACTDCHEPHGAPNKVLIRKEVNGGALGGLVTTIAQTDCTFPYDTNKEIAYLCDRCHKDDYEFNTSCYENRYYYIHHDSASGDPFWTGEMCGNCHASDGPNDCKSGRNAQNCNCCHYHGSSAAGRRTF